MPVSISMFKGKLGKASETKLNQSTLLETKATDVDVTVFSGDVGELDQVEVEQNTRLRELSSTRPIIILPTLVMLGSLAGAVSAIYKLYDKPNGETIFGLVAAVIGFLASSCVLYQAVSKKKQGCTWSSIFCGQSTRAIDIDKDDASEKTYLLEAQDITLVSKS